LFFCYALPAMDSETNEFSEEAGRVQWYFVDSDRGTISEDASAIATSIRSTPETPRHCLLDSAALLEARIKVEKHIKDTYLKRVDAPVGVVPVLKCWMELDGE